MSIRLQIAVMLFMMIQAVIFFTGAILVLATPLAREAMTLMPWVVGLSAAVPVPLSWLAGATASGPHLAPRRHPGAAEMT